MSVTEVLQQAFEDGVVIHPDGAGSLRVVGDQSMVNKWLPAIRENKTEILSHLTHKDDGASAICSGCDRFEKVRIQGKDVPGCLYQITGGEWSEGWTRLPEDMKKCLIH